MTIVELISVAEAWVVEKCAKYIYILIHWHVQIKAAKTDDLQFSFAQYRLKSSRLTALDCWDGINHLLSKDQNVPPESSLQPAALWDSLGVIC